MARRRKVTGNQIDALFELLARIENELPGRSMITVTDGDDEEQIEVEDVGGVDVGDVDLVIDLALMEFQNNGILPKKKKGTYSLSAVFEMFFGKESSIVELAIDLETTLSGYDDMIWADDVESALELIEEITDRIKEETNDAALRG